jgi:hypothetical protein
VLTAEGGRKEGLLKSMKVPPRATQSPCCGDVAASRKFFSCDGLINSNSKISYNNLHQSLFDLLHHRTERDSSNNSSSSDDDVQSSDEDISDSTPEAADVQCQYPFYGEENRRIGQGNTVHAWETTQVVTTRVDVSTERNNNEEVSKNLLSEQQKLALCCILELDTLLFGLDTAAATADASANLGEENERVLSPSPHEEPESQCYSNTSCGTPIRSNAKDHPATPILSKILSTPQRRTIFDCQHQLKMGMPTGSGGIPACSSYQSMPDMGMMTERPARPLSRVRSTPDTRDWSYGGKPGKSVLKRYCGTDDNHHDRPRLKHNVSFSNLSIREFNIALSDHPECTVGPPIQLGWNYFDQDPVPVDLYEQTRQPRNRGRRLLLPDLVRRYMLLEEAGYTKRDLQSAVAEVQRVKRERKSTGDEVLGMGGDGSSSNKASAHHATDMLGIIAKNMQNFFAGGNSTTR